MEELKKIWDRQRGFNDEVLGKNINIYRKQQLTKEFILHLISECDEVLREINWKIHRKNDKIVDKQKLKEELVDTFKYWLSIIQLWKISPEEFVEEFHRKSEVVEQRFKQEILLDLIDDKNVIAIDIDGVLADYPASFIKFVEKTEDIKINGYINNNYMIYDDLAKYVEGGKERIKEIKHEYRVSGEKRYIDTVPGSVNGLQRLKSKGYRIVLLTARPYKQYPRMFADTIEWLKKNKFPYDAIVWDENKEDRIVREFPGMQFMVEDVLENANKIANKGYKVFLINNTYNQGILHNNVVRVKGWKQVLEETK